MTRDTIALQQEYIRFEVMENITLYVCNLELEACFFGDIVTLLSLPWRFSVVFSAIQHRKIMAKKLEKNEQRGLLLLERSTTNI